MGEQVEQGAAVGGERLCSLPGARQRADGAEFADQHPAHQPVVADDDLAVGAPGGVGELHDVVAGAGSVSPNAARSRGANGLSAPVRVSRVSARVPV